MFTPQFTPRLAVLLLALGLIAPQGPAGAQAMNGLEKSGFRTGWQSAPGSYMTALHLQLRPGWKTYWRAPGEAGIPPSFDWSGSINIASHSFVWPSPEVFDLNGLRAIGYAGQMVLPLQIVAKDKTRPVVVRLRMNLGICDEICLPVTLEFSAELSGTGQPDPVIGQALARRPLSAQEAGVTGVSCRADPIGDGLRLSAEVTLPRFSGQAEAMVLETADPTIWVSEATAARSGGTLKGQSDLVGASGKPFALDRSGITLTLISGGKSVEIFGCAPP